MAGGDFPGLRTARAARQRRVEFSDSPWSFPIRGGPTNSCDVLRRSRTRRCSQSCSERTRHDIRDPLILVRSHRDHDLRVGLAVDWPGESVHHGLDGVIAMSIDARRPRQRWRQRRACGRSGRWGASSVGAVTREAHLGIDRAPAIQAALLFGAQRRAATPAAAAGCAFRILSATNCTPRALLASIAPLIAGRRFGDLQNIHRQHRLDHDIDVDVSRQASVVHLKE